MRYLGVDYGAKRTGLAVCDATETIVSPLGVLHGRKNLAGRVSEIVASENIDAVVLGLPLNMNGSEGPQAQQALAFAEELRAHIQVPVHLQDERLSSFGAEQKLQEIRLGRGKKRQWLNALAAAEILHAFLDREESDSPRQRS